MRRPIADENEGVSFVLGEVGDAVGLKGNGNGCQGPSIT